MTLKGNVSCSGQNCELNAKVVDSTFNGFQKSDVLKLKGNLKMMSGQIGAPDDSVIDQKGDAYRYDIEFDREPNLTM
ncbi:hypothetical protein BZG14_08590 [Salinivibrio sp. IB282]|nr:hypothetical protein BZG14_08590 [Salinivibrio sp. IB282]